MKKFGLCCLLICIAFYGVAELPKEHKLWFTLAVGYSPFSQAKKSLSSDSSFMPITDPFFGLELRGTLFYNYVLPVNMGSHPLVAKSNLEFGGGLELTPVTIEPFIGITFTPVPFLVFNAGLAGGTGWDFAPLGVQGLALYNYGNSAKKAYTSYTPFTKLHYAAWLQGTFQFDLAAVVPGDWNHVVVLATYKMQYEAVAGAGKRPWIWQGRKITDEEKTNGFRYFSTVILGYQMPLVLQMIGVQAEFWGNYSKNTYEQQFQNWNPTFMTVTISPFINIQFTKKQSLIFQFRFASRRSFNEPYDAYSDAPMWLVANTPGMRQTGREWFFDRLAISYNIQF